MARMLTASAVVLATTGVEALSSSVLEKTQSVISQKGLSDGVAMQVRMVEKIVKQLSGEHRQVSDSEKQTLDLVDQTLEKTTLPNIQLAHEADQQLLVGAVKSITDCNDDLHETAEIDAAKSALDDARAALAACRAKEAALLKFQLGEAKKLKNFVDATSQGPPDSLGCALPSPTQLDETPDAMGDFMKASGEWYAQKGEELDTLDNNNKQAIQAHAAQAAICNGEKQPDFEAKYCAWTALITDKRNNYVACRTQAKAALDTTFDDVTTKSGHRKSDFVAVNRVRCLLQVLKLGDEADDHGTDADSKLNACLDEVIETSQFNIAKPAYPPRDEEAVAALGDISGNEVECKA